MEVETTSNDTPRILKVDFIEDEDSSKKFYSIFFIYFFMKDPNPLIVPFVTNYLIRVVFNNEQAESRFYINPRCGSNNWGTHFS